MFARQGDGELSELHQWNEKAEKSFIGGQDIYFNPICFWRHFIMTSKLEYYDRPIMFPLKND